MSFIRAYIKLTVVLTLLMLGYIFAYKKDKPLLPQTCFCIQMYLMPSVIVCFICRVKAQRSYEYILVKFHSRASLEMSSQYSILIHQLKAGFILFELIRNLGGKFREKRQITRHIHNRNGTELVFLIIMQMSALSIQEFYLDI